MPRAILYGLCMLLIAGTGFGQSTATDSQTLQALLAEVRQLRQDLRTANAAAQRAQILIYRVQAQEGVVSRMQERIDGMRSTLGQIEHEEKRLADGIKQNEDSLEKAENPTERKEMEQMIAQLKSALEMETNSGQETQAKVAAAEEQLRVEQAKLGRLEDELDRLDKTLESSSR